jgi:membrane dipeptidase
MRNRLVSLLLASTLLSACATSSGPGVSGAAGVSPQAMAVHSRLMTLDTHLDTPAFFDTARGYDITQRHDVMRDGTQVDLPRMREGGLDGGFWVIYMPYTPISPEGFARVRDTAIMRSVRIREMVAANSDRMELAFTSSDAARINAAGKVFVYQSIENSYELGEDLTLMDTFYKLGVRLIGPVHNGHNQLADSANGMGQPNKWNGLSPLGRRFVRRANELGMVLDGSHSSDEAIAQMIELSATPIILSHHGAKALSDHPRNTPDAVLRALAAKGGVIQMNTLFLKPLTQTPERTAGLAALRTKYGNPNDLTAERYEAYLDELQALNVRAPEVLATFEDYMAQVLYCLRLIGPDHVGFGADWDGGGGVDGLRDVSYLPRITERLLREGYTEEQLRMMWGGNVLRVMKAAEDYAAGLRAQQASRG